MVDLLLYWVIFYSGATLPFINPSVEEYQRQVTSFPRNAGQCYAWVAVHVPAALIGRFGDRYLVFAVAQTGLIFFVIGTLIDRRHKGRQ